MSAGTYFLWVDGATDSYLLDVQTSAGDDCSAPLALTFVDGFAYVQGSTEYANHDFDSIGCSQYATTPDNVYTFTTTQTQSFVAHLEAGYEGLNTRPWMVLRETCAQTSSEVACTAWPYSSGSGTDLAVPNLPAGTYFLIVGSSYPSYVLSAHFVASAVPGGAESCSSPASPLSLSGTGLMTAVATGTLGSSSDLSSLGPSCKVGLGLPSDTVHKLDIPHSGALRLGAIPMGDPEAHIGLVLEGPNANCAEANEVGCIAFSSSNAVSLGFSSLAPGTYWVWAFGKTGTKYMLHAAFE